MNDLRRRFLAITIFVMACSYNFGQTAKIKFDRIGVEEGLEANMVYGTLMDRQGFMWIGSSNGLYRYDGVRFQIFRNDPADPTSLSNNTIKFLLEGKNGYIWIATQGGGLNRLDVRTHVFKRYTHIPGDPTSISNNEILYLHEDKAGVLWIGTENGLNRMDLKSETFTRYLHDSQNPESLSEIAVLSILEDKKGRLWVGTWDGGVNLAIPVKDSENRLHNYVFKHFKKNPNVVGGLSSNNIWTIHEDPAGRIWMGTFGGGLNLMLPDSSKNPYDISPRFISFKHVEGKKNSLSDDVITSLNSDKDGHLWIGTMNGLSILNVPNATMVNQEILFTNYFTDFSDSESIGDNSIRNIYTDSFGATWLSTFNGISKYDPFARKFTSFLQRSIKGPGINTRAIIEDKEGQIWLGTDGKGLLRYDAVSDTYISFNHKASDGTSLMNDFVWSLAEDEEGNIWVGSYDGISRFNKVTQDFTNYQLPIAQGEKLIGGNRCMGHSL